MAHINKAPAWMDQSTHIFTAASRSYAHSARQFEIGSHLIDLNISFFTKRWLDTLADREDQPFGQR